MDRLDTDELARRLVERATERGATVCTAESCTAGLVAALIAEVPGASAVLRGGAVTYCDEVKQRVLGVDAAMLARETAVSRSCAAQMACGARSLIGADVAVSLTGYAGPDGGTAADPAGTVYIGLADGEGVEVRRCSFDGGRNEVRRAAARAALAWMLERLG